LSDQLGQGYSVLCFDPAHAKQFEATGFNIMLAPLSPSVAEKFAAHTTSAYFIRPDMHIAGRWFKAAKDDILQGFQTVTFQEGAGV